jgi:small subunit ribosomal protein S2
MTLVTLQELLAVGAHFGHQSSRWNPKMLPYIHLEHNGIHVIDLVKTRRLLTHAYNYVQRASREGKIFLFIGTKRQAAAILSEEAKRCESHFVNHRWLGGTLTNWITIQRRIQYLKQLNDKEESGELDLISKKEAASLRRERYKLIQSVGGLTEMNRIPDIAIIVDPKREAAAVEECKKLGITIISILDTNCDPSVIDIPIPANDDSLRSIKLIISVLASAIINGKQAMLRSFLKTVFFHYFNTLENFSIQKVVSRIQKSNVKSYQI